MDLFYLSAILLLAGLTVGLAFGCARLGGQP